MAHINLRVRSDDGGRFQSIGEASERLAFGLYVLTQRGDGPDRRDPANERAAAFDRAADAFLEAAGAYHASLAAEKQATVFRCEVVRDLHLHKDLRPVARSCGKPHKNAEAALSCAKRQYGKPGLVRIGTAAAYQGDKLLCMVVASERNSQHGRTISCSGAWRPVPIVDGKPDAAAFDDIFHAIGRAAREKRGGGGYDDPKTPVLDAIDEEEEFRDALPLREGTANRQPEKP